jgi:hypothetical protein
MTKTLTVIFLQHIFKKFLPDELDVQYCECDALKLCLAHLTLFPKNAFCKKYVAKRLKEKKNESLRILTNSNKETFNRTEEHLLKGKKQTK